MSIWEELTGYLSFSFVQYALIASVLIALCSSLLGVTLVLKRFSVIGDGLSHVAFGALAIATVLRLSNSMLLVMPVTVACAVILLCANQSAKIKGDAAIAMLSVSALALGYLVQNFVVSPDEINKESKYLERNIEFTQYAYQLDNVDVKSFAADNTLTSKDITENSDRKSVV